MGRVFRGWPSCVLLVKFKELVREAECMEAELADAAPMSTELEELRQAIKSVSGQVDCGGRGTGSSGPLRGLFLQNAEPRAMAFIFNSPPSWRWMLPLVAGGAGDPLCPEGFNPEVCSAWAALGAALQRSRAAKEGHYACCAGGDAKAGGKVLAKAPIALAMLKV